MREPLLHTDITDTLDVSHPLANVSINCKRCSCPVHASNNECMSAWIETGRGPYCVGCFSRTVAAEGYVEDDWGLPNEF